MLSDIKDKKRKMLIENESESFGLGYAPDEIRHTFETKGK